MTNQNNAPLEPEQTIQPDKAELLAERPKLSKPHSVSGVERLSEGELCTLRKIALDRGRELQIRFNLRGLA
jgi:hypothetical protein